jgi:hypothetical protein
MLVAISMVDAAPARGDAHAGMQVSPEECQDVSAGIQNSSTLGRCVAREEARDRTWHQLSQEPASAGETRLQLALDYQ